MARQVRVVLVDDHPVIRDGLCFLLSEQADLAVVGEAEDAASALKVLGQVEADVLILDLTLAGQEALPLVEQIRTQHPELRILVLSMHDEMLYAERLFGMGVHGYIMKQAAGDLFLTALRRVMDGGIYESEVDLDTIFGRRQLLGRCVGQSLHRTPRLERSHQ